MDWLKEDPRSLRNLPPMIKEAFNKKVSLDTLRLLAGRKGKVWKRMRASLADQRDEESFRQCEQELMENVAMASEGEIDLYFFDEAGFGRVPRIPYAWQDRGATMELPCHNGKRLNVIGCLHFNTGSMWTDIHEESVTSASVLKVIDNLSEGAQKPRVVFIDNASIHTAGIIKDKIPSWEEKGLYLYFIPAYSPELNWIEMVWRMIKYYWLPLDANQSFKHLKSCLEHIFSEFGRTYIFNFA